MSTQGRVLMRSAADPANQELQDTGGTEGITNSCYDNAQIGAPHAVLQGFAFTIFNIQN